MNADLDRDVIGRFLLLAAYWRSSAFICGSIFPCARTDHRKRWVNADDSRIPALPQPVPRRDTGLARIHRQSALPGCILLPERASRTYGGLIQRNVGWCPFA